MTKKELIEAVKKNNDWKDDEEMTCICVIGDSKYGQNLFNGSIVIGIKALEATMKNNPKIEQIVEEAHYLHLINKITSKK